MIQARGDQALEYQRQKILVKWLMVQYNQFKSEFNHLDKISFHPIDDGVLAGSLCQPTNGDEARGCHLWGSLPAHSDW